MLPSPHPVGSRPTVAPDYPCTSCLLDLAESAGMAGAGACPLKMALLRRLAGSRLRHGVASAMSCDAFVPGYAGDLSADLAFGDAAPGRPLS